jgi:menaquinone-dependent protoporphyrinogen IX oxidase
VTASPDPIDEPRVRVLVIYARAIDCTRVIAEQLAEELTRRGYRVVLGDASTGAPCPEDYDAVVLGTTAGLGSRGEAAVARYITTHRDRLAAIPTTLFAVVHRHRIVDAVERLLKHTGWRPSTIVRIEKPPIRRRPFGWPHDEIFGAQIAKAVLVDVVRERTARDPGPDAPIACSRV